MEVAIAQTFVESYVYISLVYYTNIIRSDNSSDFCREQLLTSRPYMHHQAFLTWKWQQLRLTFIKSKVSLVHAGHYKHYHCFLTKKWQLLRSLMMFVWSTSETVLSTKVLRTVFNHNSHWILSTWMFENLQLCLHSKCTAICVLGHLMYMNLVQ